MVGPQTLKQTPAIAGPQTQTWLSATAGTGLDTTLAAGGSTAHSDQYVPQQQCGSQTESTWSQAAA